MTLTAYYAPEAAASSITARAFESLSSVSRSLLWYMDIEHLNIPDVSTIIGISPSEVIPMTAMARYEFRYAWIAEQSDNPRVPQACKDITKLLSRVGRHRRTPEETEAIQQHLVTCLRCAILEEELDGLHDHLRIALLPLVLGPDPSPSA